MIQVKFQDHPQPSTYSFRSIKNISGATFHLRLHESLRAQIRIYIESGTTSNHHQPLSYLEQNQAHIALAASHSLFSYQMKLATSLAGLSNRQLAHLQKHLGKSTDAGGGLLQMTAQKLISILGAAEVSILLKENESFILSETSNKAARKAFRIHKSTTRFNDALRHFSSSNSIFHQSRQDDSQTTVHELGIPIRSAQANSETIGMLHIERNSSSPGVLLPQNGFLSLEKEALASFANNLASFLGSAWSILLCRNLLNLDSIAVAVSRKGQEQGNSVVYVNSGASKLFGRSARSIIGNPAEDLYALGQYEKTRQALRQAWKKRKNECGPLDSKILQAHNQTLPVQICYKTFDNPLLLDSPTFVIGIFSDQQERTQKEEQHERIKNLLARKGLAYIRVDSNHRTIENTQLDLQILEYTGSEMRSRNRDDFYVNKEHRKEILKRLRSKKGRMLNFVCQLKPRVSDPIWVAADLQTISQANGEYGGYEGFYENVNDRIRLQRRINARTNAVLRLDDLVEALQENADFYTAQLMSLAHQMLTPLGSLAESLHNISHDITPKDKVPIRLKYATGQARSFAQLVRNLAFLDQILEGKGHEEIRTEKVSPRKLAIETKLNFDHLLEFKNIELIIPDDFLVDEIIRGDENLIRQVFVNIIDNAIKYSYRNTHILVQSFNFLEEKEILTIQFLNRGITIPKAQRGDIFNRGYRAPKARLRTAQGSGLGLWIVQRIVEAHDSTIECTEPIGTEHLEIAKNVDSEDTNGARENVLEPSLTNDDWTCFCIHFPASRISPN